MKVLTVNAGSSSIRLDMFAAATDGAQRVAAHHVARQETASVELLEKLLARAGDGPVRAVAHRIVHGGGRLVRTCVIDAAVEREIEHVAPLAPLHNRPALEWIRVCRSALGGTVPQIAVFDTAFFAGLPEVAHTYALPREVIRRHGIRRYGFHGIAHQAMWRGWRAQRPDLAEGGRVIALQLGAGCSITAIHDGRPLDTSMGFSPLEGLVMATRSGDVDPGLLLYLQRAVGLTPDRLERMLNEESGLLGVAGASADMRELLASTQPDARLAVALYCYRARKYVGSYLAVLGGADAILFGGGVGENAPEIRARIIEGMTWAGIGLDTERNRRAAGTLAALHAPDSGTEIHVIPVDEAAILAETAMALMATPSPTSTAKGDDDA